MLDVDGPSAIGEIKEDGDKLKTPEQRIDELDTLGTSVHASAAEANVGQMQLVSFKSRTCWDAEPKRKMNGTDTNK